MNSLENLYDIAIVGSGPASFSASIYASRYRLKNIIFGRQMGGTISDTHKVCNYPGVSDISGLELATRMYEQTKEQGAEISLESVKDIKKENNIFKLITDADKEYYSKTVIIATGTKRNKLALPREELFLGKGLSYCATCDGMFYKDKVVAVIGGSNAATMAASMLSDIAKQVYIIYRGTELRGEPAWIEVVETKENITVLFETLVIGLEGTDRLERVKLSKAYKNSSYLDVDGVFVEIGSEPNIVLPMKLGLELDERQYIKVEKDQSTNIEGIWAAGDCTTASNDFRQVVTAVAEGAIAANSIYVYLREHSIQSH
ncbi:MAG: FAD-dependent oxidoreductase [Candidatus Dojkabacteria bacterium]|nr:FAD-dependent oxidoreductase [Candidatus Dojkabacteria bacterium]MDD4561199.1 FAD-dependent oxidoreductase [Candidatus Dojkabacteria bacterium]NLB12043.1 FAD-dependent oxidoreductase [Candidatus Dojkabacteria bacterium]